MTLVLGDQWGNGVPWVVADTLLSRTAPSVANAGIKLPHVMGDYETHVGQSEPIRMRGKIGVYGRHCIGWSGSWALAKDAMIEIGIAYQAGLLSSEFIIKEIEAAVAKSTPERPLGFYWFTVEEGRFETRWVETPGCDSYVQLGRSGSAFGSGAKIISECYDSEINRKFRRETDDLALHKQSGCLGFVNFLGIVRLRDATFDALNNGIGGVYQAVSLGENSSGEREFQAVPDYCTVLWPYQRISDLAGEQSQKVDSQGRNASGERFVRLKFPLQTMFVRTRNQVTYVDELAFQPPWESLEWRRWAVLPPHIDDCDFAGEYARAYQDLSHKSITATLQHTTLHYAPKEDASKVFNVGHVGFTNVDVDQDGDYGYRIRVESGKASFEVSPIRVTELNKTAEELWAHL